MCVRYQFIKPLGPHKLAKIKSGYTSTETLQKTQQDSNVIFLHDIESFLARSYQNIFTGNVFNLLLFYI